MFDVAAGKDSQLVESYFCFEFWITSFMLSAETEEPIFCFGSPYLETPILFLSFLSLCYKIFFFWHQNTYGVERTHTGINN